MAKKTYSTKVHLEEWIPRRRTFWVVFDMCNGDSLSKRYVWWFDSKKAALAHIEHQKERGGAPLSDPHKVKILYDVGDS